MLDIMPKDVVKFEGAEERQTIYLDPTKVEALIVVSALDTSLQLPDSMNKNIIVARTDKHSYGLGESVETVLDKLGWIVTE